MAAVCGELPASLIGRIPGSTSYKETVMTALRALPEPGDRVLPYVLPQYGMERIRQEQAALPPFPLWQEPGHRNLQDAVLIIYLYAMGLPRLHEILRFGYARRDISRRLL